MRGALGATLAALRAYRRVAQVTSQRRVSHDQSAGDAPAAPDREESSGEPSRSQKRRSLIAMGAASILAVAALVAAAVGVLDLGHGSHSGQPRTVLEPYGAAPPATSSVAPVAGTATSRTPADPLSAGGNPRSPGASAPFGATGSAASGVGAPAGTTSAAPVDTATTTMSPSLADLCRSVVAAGKSWPSVLKAGDRTTVIAAAGSRKNVLPYCTALVAGASTS